MKVLEPMYLGYALHKIIVVIGVVDNYQLRKISPLTEKYLGSTFPSKIKPDKRLNFCYY